MSIEPTDQHTDFPYEGLKDWDYSNPTDALAMARTLDAFEDILEWIFKGGTARQAGIKTRIYVLLWEIRPGYFTDSTEAAVAKRIGVSAKNFCVAVSSFRDRFGNINGLVKSDEARAKYSVIRANQWKEKKGKL